MLRVVLAVVSLVVLATASFDAEAATPAPTLQIGDYWFYVVSRSDTSAQGQLNISVANASSSGYVLDVFRLRGGGPAQSKWKIGTDLAVQEQSFAGGTTRFDPAVREIPFPLAADAAADQTINVTVQPPGANATWSKLVHSSKVIRIERLKVRAGEFDSFVIERVEVGTNYTYTLWYSAEVGGLLKREYRNKGVLEENWELAGYSFGAAPPPRATVASLSPVGAGVVVGALALFAMSLLFLWKHGKLFAGPRRTRGAEPRVTTVSPAKLVAASETAEKPHGRPVGLANADPPPIPGESKTKKLLRPKKARQVDDGRRRTPEELEAEYGRNLEKTRRRLKTADATKGETKQARLLLTRAQMAAKQERHQEAIDLLVTADERLDAQSGNLEAKPKNDPPSEEEICRRVQLRLQAAIEDCKMYGVDTREARLLVSKATFQAQAKNYEKAMESLYRAETILGRDDGKRPPGSGSPPPADS